MATIILKYDARNTLAKKTLNYILSLGVFEKQEVKPYNPKFVNKILKSEKKDKRHRVNPENVFESLGIK